LIVSATFTFSLFFAVLWSAFLEYMARLKQNRPEDYARVMMFINAFFGWLPGVKKAPKT
jgi:hypothetical protein